MRVDPSAGRGGSGLVIALGTLAALIWFAWRGAPVAGLVLLALAAAIEGRLLWRLARATAGGVGGHAEWVRDVSLRPRLRSSRGWALAAALAVAGSLLCLVGCADPAVVIARPGVTSLLPHLAPAASNERLLYGGEAVLADVARPVLDQLRPFPLAVHCAAPSPGVAPSCSYTLPADLPAAGLVLVEGCWPAEPPPIPGQTEDWHFVARGVSLKCWVDGGGNEATCFDLAADPGERTPLPPETRPGLAELVAAASAHREHALARPAASQRPPSRPIAEDAERRRKLEALGYVER